MENSLANDNHNKRLKSLKKNRELHETLYEKQTIKDDRYFNLKKVHARRRALGRVGSSTSVLGTPSLAKAEALGVSLTQGQLQELCAVVPFSVLKANEERQRKRANRLDNLGRGKNTAAPTPEEKEAEAQLTRMTAASMKGRTCVAGLRQNACRVDRHGHKCVWSPRSVSDKRDFIEVDLGSSQTVYFIGTKGRSLKRSRNLDTPRQSTYCVDGDTPREWVSRYKLSYKSEQGAWLLVGEFVGNSDGETEVAHPLVAEQTERGGLRARHFRIQPLEYYNRKSMRVGFYGVVQKTQINKPKSGRRKGKRCGSGEQAQSMNDAAVCLTLTVNPSKAEARKFNYDFNCCSCHMCRGDKHRTHNVNRKQLKNWVKEELDFYREQREHNGFADFWPDVSCNMKRLWFY